jgi:hypothetical protein
MSGAIHPLPQYAFMAWCLVKSTGTTLPFTFYHKNWTLYVFRIRGQGMHTEFWWGKLLEDVHLEDVE